MNTLLEKVIDSYLRDELSMARSAMQASKNIGDVLDKLYSPREQKAMVFQQGLTKQKIHVMAMEQGFSDKEAQEISDSVVKEILRK